ncbi:MAG: RimJ/RimL family protein N-acetyltransferase [Phenylobacterium sp.]|jgi:RimJ/RimL family protein N-acetyltransferase
MSVMSPQYSALIFGDQRVVDVNATPDWSKVSLQNWQQLLRLLSEDQIKPQVRWYWMQALRGWFKENAQRRSTVIGCLGLMRAVAYNLCDWPFIIELHQFNRQMAMPSSDESLRDDRTIEQLQLAVAYWQMGQLSRADQFLNSIAADLSPGHPLLDFHQQIQTDVEYLPPHLSEQNGDLVEGDLQLCPLEAQHLASFSWVYADPNIAHLCNLPEFESDQEWLDWLALNQDCQGHTVFAVNHHQWGFIGSVFLAVHDGVGFFYFWLGEDFQGKGFGPRAVDLLMQLGKERLGMNYCYTKVFGDNMNSQQAMNKIGFNSLPFRVARPYQNQVYFYRGAQQTPQNQATQLRLLIRAMGFDDMILI